MRDQFVTLFSNRSDRDDYIKVNEEKIGVGEKNNYKKKDDEIFDFSWDWGSIMNYGYTDNGVIG